MYVTANPTQFSEFEKNFYLYIPNDLREKADEQNMKAIIKRLKEFYFNNKPATFDSVYQFSHVSIGFLNVVCNVLFI